MKKKWPAFIFLLLFITFSTLLKAGTDAAVTPADTVISAKLEAGIAEYKKGNFDHAVSILNETAALATKKKDTASLVKALNNLGNVSADKGNNPQALHYYQQALGIAESISDHKNIAHLQKNIGAVYISWKKLDVAMSYYDKALKQAFLIADSGLVADCYNNQGTVYEQQKKYDDALGVYQKALFYYERSGQKDGIAMSLSNIAIVYKLQKNYTASIAYNLRSLKISEDIGDKWMMAAIMNNIGNLYGETGDYKNAIAYCNRGLALAQEINAPEITSMAYESLADASAKHGDYKSAFAFQKKFAEEQNRFINIESTKQLSELQVKYDVQKKQHENEQLIFENELKAAAQKNAERKRSIIIYSFSGVLVFVSLIFFLVYRNRTIIAKAKEEQRINRAIFDSEQKERIRIARDLHDSIGQMLSVLKMKISSLPQDPETSGTLELVDKTIREVRTVSHNLIPEELNFGLVSAVDALSEQLNANGKVKVNFEFSDELKAQKISRQVEVSLYRIVQEVLNNMLKHSGATEIGIDLHVAAAKIVVVLTDNGKGFDPLKINDFTGIGWKNTTARVHLLNGEMTVNSEKNKGTHIEIAVPL